MAASQDKTYPSHVIQLKFGKGLAASRDLGSGVVVEKFIGYAVPYAEVPEGEKIYVLWVAHPEQYLIATSGNAKYANHSCDPNSRLNEQHEIVTIKPLKAGEEILFSYNSSTEDGFWDPAWDFECFCGSSNCQKLVNGYIDKNNNNKPFKNK